MQSNRSRTLFAVATVVALSAGTFVLSLVTRDPSAVSAPTAWASGQAQPIPGSAQPDASAASSSTGALSGTVLETMDSGGYTYARLQSAAGEVWTAMPQTQLQVGAPLTLLQAMPLENFESKTLQRRFETIYFGVPDTMAGASSEPAGHGAAHGSGQAAPGGHGTAQKASPAASIARAEGPDGRTVAEIHAARTELAGKSAAVRGQVTKVSNGILGKNWLHLQDGTGTPEGADFDLVVTTLDSAKVGDVVLARGQVAADRDIGSGYFYSVLLEDAVLQQAPAAP